VSDRCLVSFLLARLRSFLRHTFCGSPLYASPEIVSGIPYYGPEVGAFLVTTATITLESRSIAGRWVYYSTLLCTVQCRFKVEITIDWYAI
jgi:serine/threonine protein kinase